MDAVIVFRSLNRQDLRQIVHLELDKVASRLEEYSIRLEATSAALDRLSEEGYDPDFGARPLRRVIQNKVEDQLSDALLSGEFHEGDLIIVDVNEDGEIFLRRSEDPEAEKKALAAQA